MFNSTDRLRNRNYHRDYLKSRFYAMPIKIKPSGEFSIKCAAWTILRKKFTSVFLIGSALICIAISMAAYWASLGSQFLAIAFFIIFSISFLIAFVVVRQFYNLPIFHIKYSPGDQAFFVFQYRPVLRDFMISREDVYIEYSRNDRFRKSGDGGDDCHYVDMCLSGLWFRLAKMPSKADIDNYICNIQNVVALRCGGPVYAESEEVPAPVDDVAS